MTPRQGFGLGWAALASALVGFGTRVGGGYCPGPALTALSNLTAEVFVFVAAMIAGGVFARIVSPRGTGA